MAIGLIIEIPGGTQQQYDGVMKDIGDGPFDGLIFHVAGPMSGGWRVIDVWESQAHFDRFFAGTLGAALQKHEVPKPSITSFPAHNTLSPVALAGMR